MTEKMTTENIARFEEIRPLIVDLEGLGLFVNKPSDLDVVITQHPDAPIEFIKHLKKDYSSEALRWIAESLAYSETPVANEMLDIFESIENESVRWEIANTVLILNKSAPKALKVDTTRLKVYFENEKYQKSISPFIEIISKHEGKESISFLCSLLDMKFESTTSERSIISATLIALGNLKALETLEKVRKFVSHSDSWIRGKAKSALKKIEKAKE
ncbi:hypothetical protein LCGC14_2239720 [marine sediment metagenome]|uniref:HEAT repeat domain-containing protein n=2 Tax=root TaxID=1 RepID=A0A7V1CX54_9GAMM|nr:hypothetical protein [Pseudoalteromonas prydzensis]HEA15745.1 hypothetical protein [Pseudoalteromonas prydzensis]